MILTRLGKFHVPKHAWKAEAMEGNDSVDYDGLTEVIKRILLNATEDELDQSNTLRMLCETYSIFMLDELELTTPEEVEWPKEIQDVVEEAGEIIQRVTKYTKSWMVDLMRKIVLIDVSCKSIKEVRLTLAAFLKEPL